MRGYGNQWRALGEEYLSQRQITRRQAFIEGLAIGLLTALIVTDILAVAIAAGWLP